jgi:hypothetical protein
MDCREVTEAVVEISNSILMARWHNTNNLTPHARQYTREETDMDAARQLMAENGDSYVSLNKLETALKDARVDLDDEQLTPTAVDLQLSLLMQD